MEFLTDTEFTALSSPGVDSLQLLSPHNSALARVTITRVTVAVGAEQRRHQHSSSEQIWIAISGSGTLLLGNSETKEISAGQVVRFADGDTHGFYNSGAEPFVYISVTSPPIDFSYAYNAAE